MRFGVTLPNAGYGGEPEPLIALAVEAERAGWDGVFLWGQCVCAHAGRPWSSRTTTVESNTK